MNPPSPDVSSAAADRCKGFLAAGLVVLCWSGFNIVSRFGSKGTFTPFDLAALRFAVSGAIAMPFFLSRVPPRQWPPYLLLSLFGGLGYCLLVYAGFAFAPSAHAGVFVNGGIPFWTITIVAALSGWHLQRPIAIALALSLGGLLLISYDSLMKGFAGTVWVGDLLFLLAAWTWAVFGLLMRRWRMQPTLAISGIATFSSVVYLPVFYFFLPSKLANAPAFDIGLQCVYQGLIAALLAAGMYSYANQKVGAHAASMMLALVPGVSAFGAYVFLGEALDLLTVFGIILVSVGASIGALANPQKTLRGASGPKAG